MAPRKPDSLGREQERADVVNALSQVVVAVA
jgi:hypothetical protein